MKILGLMEDRMLDIQDAFANWPIIIEANEDPNMYDVSITNDIPFIFKYNHPRAKITIGIHDVELDLNEYISITFM